MPPLNKCTQVTIFSYFSYSFVFLIISTVCVSILVPVRGYGHTIGPECSSFWHLLPHWSHVCTCIPFATHVKRVASRCFYQLRQLWSVQPALSVDNARMLAHAFIASRIDYCNSVLYQTAAVHLRPFQLVLHAAARLVVKKRKSDSITPTIRDNLHWLLVRQCI